MHIDELETMDFSRFGQILSIPNNRGSGDSSYTYWRSIGIFKFNTLATGLLRVRPHGNLVSKVERHISTPEILTILSGSGVIVLKEAGDGIDGNIAAVRVRQGDSFALFPGIWHGLICPENNEDIVLLVQFEEGTEDSDVQFNSFEEPLLIQHQA
jgi:mannose-6-phosphate isomerase-like protein (cupin superfamily)